MKLSTQTWNRRFLRTPGAAAALLAPADLAGWTVGVLGDSHMNGIDTTPTATAFGDVLGLDCVNLGVNGNRTDQIAARADT